MKTLLGLCFFLFLGTFNRQSFLSTASPHDWKNPNAVPPAKENVSAKTNVEPSYEIVVGQRFQLHKKLGKGSFGVTYEAIDLLTTSKIALKVIKAQFFTPFRAIYWVFINFTFLFVFVVGKKTRIFHQLGTTNIGQIAKL
ncbi:hypothetical protein RFI_08838 [Reticulomyxa filosa]|uniref:Protein kinase domain-containing protein n=1 Tax=Reticulomyxa filosa TaxID=46433 RepID=X6NSI8_RETFI|nr:hypothetical protein RFI_08838 [Reticulomyxa filosa]|eukprot:ETO28292.1 hypothetical protein RFI_08838 [Reticulomyxa filosa]